jgi:hypothetical protein
MGSRQELHAQPLQCYVFVIPELAPNSMCPPRAKMSLRPAGTPMPALAPVPLALAWGRRRASTSTGLPWRFCLHRSTAAVKGDNRASSLAATEPKAAKQRETSSQCQSGLLG